MEDKSMLIITAPCWNCDKNMQVALVGIGPDLLYGPESFSESEIKIAKLHNVNIRLAVSKTAEKTYLANTCEGCGVFIGEWFYFANYYAPALYGNYLYKKINYN